MDGEAVQSMMLIDASPKVGYIVMFEIIICICIPCSFRLVSRPHSSADDPEVMTRSQGYNLFRKESSPGDHLPRFNMVVLARLAAPATNLSDDPPPLCNLKPSDNGEHSDGSRSANWQRYCRPNISASSGPSNC